MKPPRNRWLPLVVAVGLMSPALAEAAAPVYRTAAVDRGDLTATVTASGTLNAVVLVQVGSQISGQVRDLLADFNSEVRRGDVLARIDPDIYEAKVAQGEADLEVAQAAVAVQQAQIERSGSDVDNLRAGHAATQAQVTRAEIALEDAKNDYDRKRPLYERQVIAASDWDKTRNAYRSAEAQLAAARAETEAQAAQIKSAEAAFRMAQAQIESLKAQVKQKEAALRQAQIDLERTYIRAPVDGIVVSRNVDRGQTVAASLQAPTLFTIAQDLAQMQVDSSVSEADIGRVAVGQTATFTVDAFPGRIFTAQVLQIRKAPQVVQNVVTYNVVVSADNPAQELLPGMTANLRILVANKSGILRVPNAALRWRPPTQGPPDVSAWRPSSRQGEGAQPGQPGRVYAVGADGEPVAVPLRLGISDGTMSEILAGDLEEGRQVIIGGGPAPADSQPRFPRLF